MSENKETRVSRLEHHETKSDQKKDYCPCRCHWQPIEDFMEIPDSKLIELAEIFESLGHYRLSDGTWRTRAEDLEEREKNEPKCTCDCSH